MKRDDYPQFDSEKFFELLGKAVDAASKRQEETAPKIFAGQRPSAPDYGLSASNPICSSSLSDTERYLSRLCTEDGKKFTWTGYSSLRADCNGVKDVGIDKYDLLINGKDYASVFFAPYSGSSPFPPAGLFFSDDMRSFSLERHAFEDGLLMDEDGKLDDQAQGTSCEKKRSDSAVSAERETSLNSDVPLDNTKRCRKCGKALPPDSMFCQYCGERYVAADMPVAKKTESTDNKKTKKKTSFWKITILSLTALIVLFVIGSYVTYRIAYSAAAEMYFVRAEKVNVFPAITNVYDKNLNSYIEAGNYLLEGENDTARKQFANLEPYLDSNFLKLESEYRYANELIKEKAYSKALRLLTDLSKEKYPNSAESLSNLKEQVYQEAISQYRRGNMRDKGAYMYSAETLFKLVDGYKDSDKFLILIDAKSSATAYRDVGLDGSLTDNQFNDLISILSFEDAKEVITMCHTSAVMFLEGTWKTKDNRFYFTMDGDHSTTYNLPATNLANSYYHIEGGVFFLYSRNKEFRFLSEFDKQKEARFMFEVINLNTIKVYCYKDGSSYTLYRQ